MIRFLRFAVAVTLTAGIVALVWPSTLGGDVSYLVVSGKSMEPTYHEGDVVIVRERRAYSPGQVIAYRVPDGEPGAGNVVIHRATAVAANGEFTTRGDNRDTEDQWRPTDEDVVGTPWIHIPDGGGALRRLQDPLLLAAAACGIAVSWTLASTGRRHEPQPSS